MGNYKAYKLKNGLTVIFKQYPSFKSVYLSMAIKVGSRCEEIKLNGISHFVEHLVSKNIYKSFKVGDWQQSCANDDFNASARADRTNFDISVHKYDLQKTLKVFGTALTGKDINANDIKNEKSAVIEEILEDRGEVDYGYKKESREKYYSGNSLSLGVLGEEPVVRSFSREDIINFLGQFYQPKNIVLTIAGDVNEKEIIDEIKRSFKFAKRSNKISSQWKEFSMKKRDPCFLSGRPDQVWFNLYLPWSTGSDPDVDIKREFFVALLRQYLLNNFRDTGFCYVIGINALAYSDYSDVGVSASFEPAKTVKFCRSLKKKLNDFRGELNDTVLKSAQNDFTSTIELDSDYPKIVANNLSWDYITFGSGLSILEQKEIIKKITVGDLRGMFDELMRNVNKSVFIGGKLNLKVKKEVEVIWFK